MSTVPANAPTTLDGLKAAYLADLTAFIAVRSAQEVNRASYEKEVAGARLAVLTKRFCSKGGFTDVPKGTVVLVLDTYRFPDEDPDDVTFYVPTTRVGNRLPRSGFTAKALRYL